MKLPDGTPSAQVGMMNFSPVAKTPPKPLQSRLVPECGLSPDSRAGVGLRRSGGSANSSTVSSSTSGPGGRGGTTARSSSGTPSARSTVIRRVSTPVSRPLLSLGGLLGSNSFHTEYREQMSPSWWLGAAACSSSWLQLSPPPEVMELVEKKKLTEQFKTVEGLIDRADYLGALRLQADRRNILHLLALDEQEMQAYLWQPRFPRIIDLRNRTGEVQTRPPPRHANCIVNPVNLWLRFLTLSPPLYAAHAPMAAVSPKTPQTGEHSGGEPGWSQPQETGEVQEYCLGSSGEQFLPILFEDSGGTAECVPPEELLTFEEEALREVAAHIEAKLAHALSCMVLASAVRSKASAVHLQPGPPGRGLNSEPARPLTPSPVTPVEPPAEQEPQGPGGGPSTAPSAGRLAGPKRRRPSVTAVKGGSRSSSPLQVRRSSSPARKPRSAGSAAAPGASGSPTSPSTSAAVRGSSREDSSEAAQAGVAPTPTEDAPDIDRVVIELEDLFTTYGPSPSLMRHLNCFQKTPDLLRQQLR